MERRSRSPLQSAQRNPQAGDINSRDYMIMKLKNDLNANRGAENDLITLENYLSDLNNKAALLIAEKDKINHQGNYRVEMSIKNANQAKKEVEYFKNEFKNTQIQLKQQEAMHRELKKELDKKIIEINELKEDGLQWDRYYEKLMQEQDARKLQQEEIGFEIRKGYQNSKLNTKKLAELNSKAIEAKQYIDQKNNDNKIFEEKLKGYENQNNGIGEELMLKQGKIGDLEQIYIKKHEQIKPLLEKYIELQHSVEHYMSETKHRHNLLRKQIDNNTQKENHIKKLQKTLRMIHGETQDIQAECRQLENQNKNFHIDNEKLNTDLANCKVHLQNQWRQNAYLQQQMQLYLREDDAIIDQIRGKKLLPTLEHYQSMRTSRTFKTPTSTHY